MTDLTMAYIKNLEQKNEALNNILQNSAKETASSKIMSNEKILQFYTKIKNIAFSMPSYRKQLDD